MAFSALFLVPPAGSLGRNVVRDFVYGCWCNGRRIGGMQMPPLNMLYAATHCRQPGVEVEFLDATISPERYESLHAQRMAGVDVLALMTSTQSFQDDAALLRAAKQYNPAITGVLFGSHPTFMPAPCLAEDAVDFIVLREPEETLRQLVGALARGESTADLPGLGYRGQGGQVALSEPRPFMDMDDLPIPDRSLLPPGVDYFNPVVKRMPYTTMQTSRGCPGRCIFCTAPSFYGRKYRYRSAEGVLAELRQIKAQGYREVFFRDETFTAMGPRNRELCQAMIDEKLDLSWIANGRVDMVDLPTLRLMKKAGCHMVKFGVETGSDELLKAYKKGTTVAQARQAFAWAREAGLDTHAHIVLGGPGETLETVAQTVRFVKELMPSNASFGILTPYPGTELFDRVAREHPEIGDGSGSNMDDLHVKSFFSQSICGLTPAELERALVKAYRSFYLRPNYVWRRLRGIQSLEELGILSIAGLNIVGFAVSGNK